MATVKGVNRTLIDAGGVSTILGGMIDGRVKVMLDTYALTTGNLSGDVIKLGGTLPVGANVIAIVLSVSAAQSSLTASVGDSGSATRYVSASTALQTAVTPLVISGKNYVVATSGTDDIILLTTGGATATAATLYAAIFYSVD